MHAKNAHERNEQKWKKAYIHEDTVKSSQLDNYSMNELQTKEISSIILKPSGLFLGVDPGSLVTGFGVVRREINGHIEHVAHGVIKLNAQKNPSERLMDLAVDMQKLLAHYSPEWAAIEEVFFCKNAQSALILGQARGVILGVLGLMQIPVVNIAPTEAKLLVTGRGRALKSQVAKMVSLRLNVPVPTHEDASDALGIALAAALLGIHRK